MIRRVEKFTLSKTPYAVRPESLTVQDLTYETAGTIHPYFIASVEALWVRRTKGLVGVHTGRLGTNVPSADMTFEEFCDVYANARYGGAILARWDGRTLWTPAPTTRAEQDDLLMTLEPAFEHLAPLIEARQDVTVPPTWTGWFELTDRPAR